MFPSLCVSRVLRAGQLIALCALALLPLTRLFAAQTAPAQPPSPMQIGVIDLDRVMTEYEGAKLAQAHLEAFRGDKEKLFNTLELGVGLPKKDFDVYQQDVADNGKLDDKHIKEQQDLAKKNVDERQTLKAKKPEELTAAEKTRIENWMGMCRRIPRR